MELKPQPNNYITISLISLKESCYIKSTGSGHLLGQLLKLFKHSTNINGFTYLIEPVQQYTSELKVQIHEFIDKYSSEFPALNGFRTFLKPLPENYYFLIVKGKITDTALIMKHFAFLTRYHNERGMQQEIHEKTFDWGTTFEHYNMHSYGHQRRNIGGSIEKKSRVCRFCDTINSQTNKFGSVVTFRNKSHAFSEALGNKTVVCLDECDACNDRFSRNIELSLINYVTVFRSLYGLKGKNGVKKLVGENFVLDPNKGLDIQYDGIIDSETNIDHIKTDLNLKETIIPQDIYRCLVKFVLSLIDEKYMSLFSKTIDWVNGTFDADALPKISFLQTDSFYSEQSMICYFQRKGDQTSPYMIGEFHYADMVFIFLIPFCDNDNQNYTSETEYQAYWKEFNSVRLFHDWSDKDFSSMKSINMTINLNINGINIDDNTFISYQEE
ncbi:hypothetical protein [Chitinophaga sp. MM2321]|uniref:hypothetical protein n=1 Tax=Chitinophaga sp. MM2321 TaxID=3137178 RepID=UPI0032D5957D